MNAWFSVFAALFLVIFLVLLSLVGVGAIGLNGLFGVYIPYVASAIFLIGVIIRVLQWAKIPVPFRIPTTCGQAKSLPWIKANNLEAAWSLRSSFSGRCSGTRRLRSGRDRG